MPKLDELVLRRQAELGSLLAGCAYCYPRETLCALQGVDMRYLRDKRAISYLTALNKRRSEIDAADETRAIEIAVSTALEMNLGVFVLKWQSRLIREQIESGRVIERITQDAIAELKRLVITFHALRDLSQTIKTNGWVTL